MSKDLLADLKIAAAIAGPNARDLYLAAAAEIERCHARLEIDHHYVLDKTQPNGFRRIETPYKDRATFPDAVACREATIKELERTN
jgi:hypothetical protein